MKRDLTGIFKSADIEGCWYSGMPVLRSFTATVFVLYRRDIVVIPRATQNAQLL